MLRLSSYTIFNDYLAFSNKPYSKNAIPSFNYIK